MNPLPECCFPHSAPIPHQFVMKVYVDAWIYVTEKFVNMGNIELYEGVLRYEKADYPPIPNFISCSLTFCMIPPPGRRIRHPTLYRTLCPRARKKAVWRRLPFFYS